LYIFAAAVTAVVLVFAGFELSFAIGQASTADVQKVSEVRYIAHRGLSSVYYENTADAFIAAGESRFFYGIETDVWLTVDGVWMCAHDDNPFADCSKRISGISYAEASSLPLKEAEGVLPLGENARLCDFSTYLRICRDAGKVPIIEIKFGANKDRLVSLLAATTEILSPDGVQYISFQKSVVDDLLSLHPQLIVQLLVKRAWDAYKAVRMGYHIGVSAAAASQMLAKTQNGNQRYLNVWTVNDPAQAVRLADMGADFITTDCILFDD